MAIALSSLAQEPPSVFDFSRYANVQEAKISPSGKYLALTNRRDDREAITVLELAQKKVLTSTNFGTNQDIAHFDWVSDKRLLIEPAQRFPGYTAYKSPTGEIIGMNADGSRFTVLFGYRAGERQTGSHLQRRKGLIAMGHIIDLLPQDPKHVVIEARPFSNSSGSSYALKLDVYTGATTRLASSGDPTVSFITNSRGEVVLRNETELDGVAVVGYRANPRSDFQRVLGLGDIVKGRFIPLGSSSRPDVFYALDDRDYPTLGLVEWDPHKKGKRMIYRNPEVDIGTIMATWYDHKVYAVRYDDNYPNYFYVAKEHPLTKAHLAIRKAFPKNDVTFTSVTRDLSKAVVLIDGDRNPGTYYLLDVASLKLTKLISARPWLAGKPLAEMRPFEITVRDGLKVRGYLSVPPGLVEKNLPMVVFVHGGPHGIYDAWHFDPVVQLLASRGYVVLQVNYRGSGGRGREFEHSGYGKWGREMQDDVTDATRWVVSTGLVDGGRICIFGGSYGGYAALTGAFREPDLYRCAIGYSGVYDLPLMFKSGDIPKMRSGLGYLYAAIGRNVEEMKRRSPVYNAAKIKAAVLLAHGKLDVRAPIEHAYRLRDALREAGNPAEWFVESGESHGFFSEKNRTRFYQAVLDFLDRHIGQNL